MDTTLLSSIKIELANIYDDDELLEIKIALGQNKITREVVTAQHMTILRVLHYSYGFDSLWGDSVQFILKFVFAKEIILWFDMVFLCFHEKKKEEHETELCRASIFRFGQLINPWYSFWKCNNS